MKRIAVIGTGYVGLVTATCFASLGNDVTCVDIDTNKVARLQRGEVPIYEPGLEELCGSAINDDHLHFTTDITQAVPQAEIVFLALPTPPGEDGSADLSYILGVADELGPLLRQYTVIITKSTVPVGTADQVHERIAAKAQAEFDVVSNPEFLREGQAIHDFMQPDRIVIGTGSERAKQVLTELYEPISSKGYPILWMDERSSELTKYAANAFLALKITFINQIANMCEQVGADVDAIRVGIGSDERISPHFLRAGIGYGGSCFPKDVLALRNMAEKAGCDLRLLDTVVALNTAQQRMLVDKVLRYFEGNIENKTFAVWGLAFKDNTDDIRQSAAVATVSELAAAGAKVRAYDPEATENAKKALGNIEGVTFVDDQYDALENADALLIATEWPQFGAASLELIKQLLARPLVFDGRNMLELSAVQEAGLEYLSIGRLPVRPA